MIFKKRPDGKLVRDLPSHLQMFPYIMPRRTASAVYYRQKIDLTGTMRFCGEHDIKIFPIFITALARVAAERPDFNRFLVGKRLYQRHKIVLTFIAKRELSDTAEEINVIMEIPPEMRLFDIQRMMREKVSVVKKGDGFDTDKTVAVLNSLPSWLKTLVFSATELMNRLGLLSQKFIDENPLFCTAYVTNVGSIGLDAPFHHMFDWGNVSVFAALGNIHRDYLVDGDSLRIADVVNVTFTIDERITDGVYMARSLQLFKEYMENPERLV